MGANDPRVGAIERNPAPLSGWQRHKFAEDALDDPRSLALPDLAALAASSAANDVLVARDDEPGRPEESRGGPIRSNSQTCLRRGLVPADATLYSRKFGAQPHPDEVGRAVRPESAAQPGPSRSSAPLGS